MEVLYQYGDALSHYGVCILGLVMILQLGELCNSKVTTLSSLYSGLQKTPASSTNCNDIGYIGDALIWSN